MESPSKTYANGGNEYDYIEEPVVTDMLIPQLEHGMTVANQDYEVLTEKVDSTHEEAPEDQVRQYAEFLGFDLETDLDLLWIARNGLEEPFPTEWKILRQVDTRKIVYFNSLTNESSEDDPRDIKYRDIFRREKEKKNEIAKGDAPQMLFSAPSIITDHKVHVDSHDAREDDDRYTKAESPVIEVSSALYTTGSFRRSDSKTMPISSSTKDDMKDVVVTRNRVPDEYGSREVDPSAVPSFQPTRSSSFSTRMTAMRSSLSEDDADYLEDDGLIKDTLRRNSSLREITVHQKRQAESVTTPNNGVTPISTQPVAASLSAPPSTVSASPRTKETRESRHRETIKRIEAEITVLREDIVETRRYADGAAARAQQAHADCLKAEARARLAEGEQARLRSELAAVLEDGERRRQALKDELDEMVKRLVAAEDARDAAEKRTREILLEESKQVRHVEREMEILRARLERALNPSQQHTTMLSHVNERNEKPSGGGSHRASGVIHSSAKDDVMMRSAPPGPSGGGGYESKSSRASSSHDYAAKRGQPSHPDFMPSRSIHGNPHEVLSRGRSRSSSGRSHSHNGIEHAPVQDEELLDGGSRFEKVRLRRPSQSGAHGPRRSNW